MDSTSKNMKEEQDLIEILDKIKQIESIDTHSAYLLTLNKIKIKNRKERLRLFYKYAAMLAIPLLITTITLSILLLHPQQESKALMTEVFVPMGTVVKYELPDKSIVWLNSGSKLKFPSAMNSESDRNVTLDGEAYFSVSSNKEHPFYVHTAYGVSTYVYGTEFNVEAYSCDNKFKVTLVSGVLDVLDHSQNTKYQLNPGKQLDLKDGEFFVSDTHTSNNTGWKDGKLVFDDISIIEIVKKLERYYNVKVEFENASDEDLEDFYLRAIFYEESLEQILDYLSESIGLKWAYSQKGNQFNKKHIFITI